MPVDISKIVVRKRHAWVMLARYDLEQDEARAYVKAGSIPFSPERMMYPQSIVGPVCYACEAHFHEALESCPGD